MPFDSPMFTAEELLPENLNFPVEFEPTKVADKKYVINGNTGDYLGVVGSSFKCANHGDFFVGVHEPSREPCEAECESMNIRFKTARNTTAMADMSLPEVTARIESDKHSTTIAQRIIALHGVDGSCSNQVYFGAIDFFCTNGMITGEYDDIRRKNTSGFDIDKFIKELKGSTQAFYAQSERLQRFANKTLFVGDVKAMLESCSSQTVWQRRCPCTTQRQVSVGKMLGCTVPSPTTPAMLMSVTVSACVTLARTPTPSRCSVVRIRPHSG